MADVTVNIRGDASQLRNELDSVGRQTGANSNASYSTESNLSNNRMASTPNDRMIEDVRREMQQRGVVMVPGSTSMRQFINQYEQSQRQVVNDRIEEKYNARREDMRSRMSADYDEIDQNVENQRNARLGLLSNPNDPLAIAAINQQMNSYRDQQYKTVGQRYDKEEEQINQDEAEEKSRAEEELTQAIKQLTEYFERQSEANGGTENSFIGQLKQKQRALIQERDTATTEEGAMDASRRLVDVNEQLRRTMSGGSDKQGGGGLMGAMVGAQGVVNATNSAMQGDIGGMVMGAALATKNPYVIAGGAVLGGVSKIAGALAEDTNAYGRIAATRSATGGLRGAQGTNAVENEMATTEYNPGSLGMSNAQFAERGFQLIRQRGTGADWIKETYENAALEKSFAMDDGALTRGAKYDRYGINNNDALVNLVTRLVATTQEGRNTGVSFENFARVQEKYDIQQRLMAGYGTRTNAPDFDVANRMVTNFSAIQGAPQDERLGDHISIMQNAIQNPMNERMRALVNSSVADLFPETGGRMDLIDRKLRDPENEPEIMQAVIQRITKQFGGTDTQMGYFAMKSIFPNIDAKSMDAYVEAANKGGLTKEQVEKGGLSLKQVVDSSGNLKEDSNGGITKATNMALSEQYMATSAKALKELENSSKNFFSWFMNSFSPNNATVPKANTTKGGGYR